MSRTIRKKHTFHNESQFKRDIQECRDQEPGVYEWRMINMGRLTLDQHYEKNERGAIKRAKYFTTDNGSKGWRPWTQSLKQANARKSRSYKRRELAKVYRDWEYDVEHIKYNRYDNRWYWD